MRALFSQSHTSVPKPLAHWAELLSGHLLATGGCHKDRLLELDGIIAPSFLLLTCLFLKKYNMLHEK